MKKIKSLGQHFLNDQDIAQRIVHSLQLGENPMTTVVEIGPGEGVLTQYLLDLPNIELYVVELDRRLPALLLKKFPQLEDHIIHEDILKVDLETIFTHPFCVIGNFPYNISTEIIFKMIEYRHKIPQMVGMFQKEVAQRIAAKPGSKTYGVTSVLTQLYFDVEYLFEVSNDCFTPPPKVQSAVIRLQRHTRFDEKYTYKKVRQIVKLAFGQRRKKLSNALKGVSFSDTIFFDTLKDKRAEQLSVEDFVELSLFCQ
ncbi:MAG: 16S rRNA (adenine(1518)-N(6)/adenine(1519)-N(6))-dimethyltransferase RsmA [Chitinophagales bacterium]